MREVTLYEIKEHRVMAGNYVQLMKKSYLNPSDFWRVSNSDDALTAVDIQTFAVPVQYIKAYGKDRFVAIHPDLAAILEAPVRAEMENLLYCRRLGKQAFDALPWWKRAWLAIRKVHPNVN